MNAEAIDSIRWQNLCSDLEISTIESAVTEMIGEEALQLAREAHKAVLVRMLETALISHPAMLSMVRTPNVYLGREDREIRSIFANLGFASPTKELVNFFISIIRGRVAQTTTKPRISTKLFSAVVQSNYRQGDDFRCADCGYHFLKSDMATVKGEDTDAYGVIFGLETPPQRFRDPWKPARVEYRYPNVDHIQPEAALGGSVVENLRIICGFCNSRKQIARRPLDSFSARISSSLMAIVGGTRGQWAIESAVYFTICQNKACAVCSVTYRDTELTAVPITDDYKWTGLLPWQLRVVCYEDSGL